MQETAEVKHQCDPESCVCCEGCVCKGFKDTAAEETEFSYREKGVQ